MILSSSIHYSVSCLLIAFRVRSVLINCPAIEIAWFFCNCTASNAAQTLIDGLILSRRRDQRGSLSSEKSWWFQLSQAMHWRESLHLDFNLSFTCLITSHSIGALCVQSNTMASYRRKDSAPCKSIYDERIPSITLRSFLLQKKASPLWSTPLLLNAHLHQPLMRFRWALVSRTQVNWAVLSCSSFC